MHIIDQRLQRLPKISMPDDRMEVVWSHYEAVTGDRVARPPTEVERQKVHGWLRGLQGSDDPPMFFTKRSHLESPVSLSPLEKASRLAQHWCTACEPVMDSYGVYEMYVSFPIQVGPWSAQSDYKRNAVIKAAVAAELSQRTTFSGPPSARPMCVGITALVPRSAARKDVDNLAKGLLDSLNAVVYVDDRQIQCLTSRRIEYCGVTGLYLVAARAVRAWEEDVAWDSPDPPIVVSGSRIVV
ncbi:RusA family crossover junction endodeoxyribonuclease [Nocardia sp. NPDC057272]|uniref:RusA family crossover junction endodeoxyribonuclease n=1 Tax=Nocardia sp. NPDC057272 TaxID=3346079 RepID=UPI003638CDE2